MTSSEVLAPRLPWDAADPYPFYEMRRRRGDVSWDDVAQGWLVVGYHAARQVLNSPDWVSDPFVNPVARAASDPLTREIAKRSMLVTDGAVHARLRGSVRDVFTRSFVGGLAEGVAAIVAGVVDSVEATTEFEFMQRVALPIPVGVVAEWMDLPGTSTRLLRELSPAIIRMLGTLADTGEVRDGTAASATLMAEFLPLAADRRIRPREDLLSFIAGDPDLELDDVVTTAILIAVAGHETTANLLGAAMIRLLTPDPDGVRLADVVDATDPAVVTELLRLDAPVQAALRTAVTDTRIGDIEIRSGTTALVAVAAANRDPALYEAPGDFRLDRAAPPPQSVGFGAHPSHGASLARREITAAQPRILARRPQLTGPVAWRDTPAIRGPLSVPMAFRER